MTPREGGFFDNLDAWTRTTPKPAPPSGLLSRIPFRGGWIVYLGYEAAAEIERHLELPASSAPLTAFALRIEHFAVHELSTGRVFVVSEAAEAPEHHGLLADLTAGAELRPQDGVPIPIEWLGRRSPSGSSTASGAFRNTSRRVTCIRRIFRVRGGFACARDRCRPVFTRRCDVRIPRRSRPACSSAT